jgi:hypothetical protein
MLLVLGSALDLPRRDRNTLFVATGFAPVYRISHQVISHFLKLHEPHPAILLDSACNVLRFNTGTTRLFTWCGVSLSPGATQNAQRLLFDVSLGLRPFVVNFDAVADAALARLRTEADVDASLRDLLAELELHRGAPPERPEVAAANPVAPPLHLHVEGHDLRYCTTIATLDVTAQELRIESFFPLDDATDAFGRELAKEQG